MEVDTEFAPFLKHNFSDANKHCEYDLRIFPSADIEALYRTNKPGLYTAIVVLVFVFTAMVFILYDYLVQRRQDKVMATAKRTNAIVSSLFPSNVRDRILADAKEQAEADIEAKRSGGIFGGGGGAGKNKLKEFLDEDIAAKEKQVQAYDTKPIADLFPNTTIMVRSFCSFFYK